MIKIQQFGKTITMREEFECGLGQGDQNAGHNLQVIVADNDIFVYGTTSPKTTKVSGWINDEDIVRFATAVLNNLTDAQKAKLKKKL